MLNMCPPGLLGFAQKLSIKRGNKDAMGKIANAFLEGFCELYLLVAAMMADGATEAMVLIRSLDDEDMETTHLCQLIQHTLDHLTWLFFDHVG